PLKKIDAPNSCGSRIFLACSGIDIYPDNSLLWHPTFSKGDKKSTRSDTRIEPFILRVESQRLHHCLGQCGRRIDFTFGRRQRHVCLVGNLLIYKYLKILSLDASKATHTLLWY